MGNSEVRCEALNYICHLANQTANFVLNFVSKEGGKLKRRCDAVSENKTILNIYLNGKSDQRTKGETCNTQQEGSSFTFSNSKHMFRRLQYRSIFR